MMNRIKIGTAEDRLTLVTLLAKNGYTVRIVSVPKPNKKSDYFVEYEENAKDGS